jgi:hypothetical protein
MCAGDLASGGRVDVLRQRTGERECAVSQDMARDVTCGSASNAEQLFRVCIA